MAKIAVDWAAYDFEERAFELALSEGKATLAEHPLPGGGVLSGATEEQVALAARQFEQRGRDLLAIAEWLKDRSAPTSGVNPLTLGAIRDFGLLGLFRSRDKTTSRR
jgi:hypothetical protein